MFKAIWPVMLVAALTSAALMEGLRFAGVNTSGMGLPLGMVVGVCFWPWLFKRLDAAADRGEL